MRSIWAVATNTIRQALRMKVAVVFMIVLFVLLPVLGFSATGDETLKGRLQTFVSYSLSLMSFLLCLLTIIVSVYTVTSDIEQRQIFTVITKPIRRYEFLLGKLLGVILLDVMLLGLFSAVIYTVTIYMPQFTKASEAEIIQANNQFFTARAALTVPEEDVTEIVQARYDELERRGELPDEPRDEIITIMTKQAQLSKRAADVGQRLVWEFENVKPLARSMFIRFKYDIFPNPPDSQVYGGWLAGDDQYIKYGEQPETPIYQNLEHKHAARTFHEVEFPSDVVPEDGRLAIAFINLPLNRAPVIFPLDGLEVLYKADSFGANFVRAVLLIFFRLIFLACLGIMAATFLSFPVAVLFCLVLFFTASFSGFVVESFTYLSESVGTFYSYTIKWVIEQILPQFDAFNPTKFLVPARLLTWSDLARSAIVPPWWNLDGDMIFVKAALLFLLGLLIFKLREIARIIV